MALVRSPLGAVGSLMVLLHGIVALALWPTNGSDDLQRMLIWAMIGNVSFMSVAIASLVGYLAWKKPWYLFSPSDIDPSAHRDLYRQERVDIVSGSNVRMSVRRAGRPVRMPQ